MKKQLLLLATLFFFINSNAQIPSANLIKDYKFTNGTIVSDINPSLQAGTPTLVPTGSARTVIADRNSGADKAISLNGDSFVAGGTNAAVVNNYTVSFWIKTTTNEATKRYIFDQHNSAPNPAGFSISLKDGKIYFNGQSCWISTTISGNSGVRQVISPVINDGQWHHIVCSLGTTSSFVYGGAFTSYSLVFTYNMYVDNVFAGGDSESDNPAMLTSESHTIRSITPTKQLVIGKSPDVAFLDYQDGIDQIRFYERKLTPAEIDILYNEDKPKTPIFVNSNATGLNNGTSWTNAYTNLETAITASNSSNEIWVAAGTYKPSGASRTSTFLLKDGLTMYGGFNGTETIRDQRNPKNNITILSGDVNGNDNTIITATETTRQDNLYHVISVRGSAVYILIDGFTITGGNANGGTLTSGTASAQYYHTRGGAVYLNTYTLLDNINLKMQNCIFEKNSGSDTGVAACYFAGGINYQTFRLDLDSCIIRNNFSGTNAQILIAGAGGFNWNGLSEIKNCLFHNNTSTSGASCLYLSASTANGGTQNSISVDVINATFANNTGTSGNTIRTDNGSNTRFKNCIIYNNGSTAPFFIGGTLGGPVVQNTISEGGQISSTNSNPLLNPDYSLASGSPAINSGNNSLLINMPFDLNGNDRIVNSIVDMGAIEYNSALNNTNFDSYSQFTIYPNPATEEIKVKSSETIESITIVSLEGRKTKTTSASSINISDLANGIYVMQVTTESGKTGNKKFVKN